MWDKIAEYVKQAVGMISPLLKRLVSLISGLSGLTTMIGKLREITEQLAGLDTELQQLAAYLRKAAPTIQLVWPHGANEFIDTAKGVEALGAFLVALHRCVSNPNEETLKALEEAAKNPDLKQLKPTF